MIRFISFKKSMNLRLAYWIFAVSPVALLEAGAQSEISAYMSEAELGALIGQRAKLEGVFHRDAFNAPAIVVTGRVFYLLENPPTNRRYSFSQISSHATVTGTLYLYDGDIQYNELYDRIGRRYYFFSLDAAEIEFGDPLRNRGDAAPIRPRSGN